jgi:hypothetical protein
MAPASALGPHVVEKHLPEVVPHKRVSPVFHPVPEINDSIPRLLLHSNIRRKADGRRLSAVMTQVNGGRDLGSLAVAMPRK